jgi:DNA modification methylase
MEALRTLPSPDESWESLPIALEVLGKAANDRLPVSGWTHNFYRYPARFSPRFAAAAVEQFSKPGDLILDPYMGGGTAIVEGIVAGRTVMGSDLNSLAVFVARVKTSPLSSEEAKAVRAWANSARHWAKYRNRARSIGSMVDPVQTRNLSAARARFIKKAIACGLAATVNVQSRKARRFAKCVLLRVGQWALDGRSTHTRLADFRDRIAPTAETMLDALDLFRQRAREMGGRAELLNSDAASLRTVWPFESRRASLVVTSPPYPGVHVLYHRWQVDGRRETPAPYWICGCRDGKGASFYNFADRREKAADNYFNESLRTLRGIRSVVRDGGYMVQLVAFNRPHEQLERYLETMSASGFAEVCVAGNRVWREVPNRKWHATLRGQTNGANEVVLVHRAV